MPYRKEYGLSRRCAPRNDMQRTEALLRAQRSAARRIRHHLRIRPKYFIFSAFGRTVDKAGLICYP